MNAFKHSQLETGDILYTVYLRIIVVTFLPKIQRVLLTHEVFTI